MKKDYDFEEGDGKEMSEANWERARILVKIIPFVLIIVLLAITFLVNKKTENQPDSRETSLQNPETVQEEASLPEREKESLLLPETSPSEAPQKTQEPEIPSPTPYEEVMEEVDLSKVKFDTEKQLAEMMAYWEDSNQKALDDLANLDRFKAMSWQLKGTDKFYYYGDKNGAGQPQGKGIAVYADNQYYYGDWVGGKRSGNGTWMHYHIHVTPGTTDIYTYHQYVGSWKNDLPDGEGSEHFDFNESLLKENEYYNSNLIGSYKEGLIDGEFYITTIESNQSMKEWEAEASGGAWLYQNDNVDPKGNRTVQIEIHNPENYIWMHPKNNHNIGVPCLIVPGGTKQS